MSEAEHSPLPWKIAGDGIVGADGVHWGTVSNARWRHNLLLVVAAVNSHAAAIELARYALSLTVSTGEMDALARKVLELAGVEGDSTPASPPPPKCPPPGPDTVDTGFGRDVAPPPIDPLRAEIATTVLLQMVESKEPGGWASLAANATLAADYLIAELRK